MEKAGRVLHADRAVLEHNIHLFIHLYKERKNKQVNKLCINAAGEGRKERKER